ncbi:hypothetical protein HO173_012313 [Letharia columbiana]|uniref:Uncharacterized protein n=1 Tax=Letharia columbiana TaxID=112416 RepID=A0A8H6CP23_9LECA|nr:uncharacterized protein HO173_012313 [Letharia columbiana]KAF6226809.1 hypothetical protein HO173_012313 [Letharia columbiana]
MRRMGFEPEPLPTPLPEDYPNNTLLYRDLCSSVWKLRRKDLPMYPHSLVTAASGIPPSRGDPP